MCCCKFIMSLLFVGWNTTECTVFQPTNSKDMMNLQQHIFISINIISYVMSSIIIESPHSTKVTEGSPISLSCRIDSDYSDYQIRWYKDGRQIDTQNPLHRILTLPDGTLFFLSSEVEDTGKYYCVVL